MGDLDIDRKRFGGERTTGAGSAPSKFFGGDCLLKEIIWEGEGSEGFKKTGGLFVVAETEELLVLRPSPCIWEAMGELH